MSSTEEPSTSSSVPTEPQASKKRKAEALDDVTEDEIQLSKVEEAKAVADEDDDDGMTCPICLESWTSSGEHRISSLRCGHFFGLLCIEKWLKNGNDCPNCNDKATKKDIRPHYVKKLKAVDTGEKDRALKELAETRKELRSLQLEHSSLKVTCQTRKEEIEKLTEQIRLLRSGIIPGSIGNEPIPVASSSLSGNAPQTYSRLLYVKRLELFRRDSLTPENLQIKYCKVMAYNENHGMLVVSQPSFTALAPGFGVRRINMLDRRLESFIGLHKEPIRDLAVNPVFQDQLLSVSQDKTVRLTNVSNCAEIHRWHLESEVWSCVWNAEDPNIFYVGTKRCELFVYDTRVTSGEPKLQLQFPLNERRPIISLCFVPKQANHPSFPCSGILVQTLGTMWFFEFTGQTGSGSNDGDDVSYKVHKLSIAALFWSLKFDLTTRLFLASTKPQPHARHLVCELSRINVSEDPNHPDFQISTNVIMDQGRGGSYADRSFLRSALCPRPGADNQMLILFGRGSGQTDHKLIVQEVGNEKVLQEIPVERPIIDICAFTLNGEHYVTVLNECELFTYKWGSTNSS